jgi:hypothetical protein
MLILRTTKLMAISVSKVFDETGKRMTQREVLEARIPADLRCIVTTSLTAWKIQ